MPRVSVIIPVHGHVTLLAKCLDALARQSVPPGDIEVLVVDNGGNPGIEDVCAGHANVRLLKEGTPGSYAARNRALPAARGEFLAFTDADCLPDPRWLEAGLARLTADPALGAVGGRIELFTGDPRRPTAAELYDLALSFPQERYVRDQHFAATANLLTRRKILDQVGPFDATLRSGGDQDWGVRAWKAGVRLAYAPEAVVRHPARRTFAELAAKTRRTHGGHMARVERERQSADSPGAADADTEKAAWPGPVGKALRLAAAVLPPVPQQRLLRKVAPAMPRRHAARVFFVIWGLNIVQAAETMRLRLGGRARR